MQVIDCRKAAPKEEQGREEPANQHSKILQPKVGPKGAAAGGQRVISVRKNPQHHPREEEMGRNTKSRLLLDFSRGAQRVPPVCCGLMGRVRESRPVSTRPRRPCPPFPLQSPISKGQWYKRYFECEKATYCCFERSKSKNSKK